MSSDPSWDMTPVANPELREGHIVAEGTLRRQAAAAARVFRDTVRQVSQAAAALALPEPEAREAREAK